MDYKEGICQMINDLSDETALRFVYGFVKAAIIHQRESEEEMDYEREPNVSN